MRKLSVLMIVSIILAGLVSINIGAAQTPASPLVIVEVFNYSQGTNKTDFWDYIEFMNVSAEPVDLADYDLWYATTDEDAEYMHRLAYEQGEVVLQSGETIILWYVVSQMYDAGYATANEGNSVTYDYARFRSEFNDRYDVTIPEDARIATLDIVRANAAHALGQQEVKGFNIANNGNARYSITPHGTPQNEVVEKRLIFAHPTANTLGLAVNFLAPAAGETKQVLLGIDMEPTPGTFAEGQSFTVAGGSVDTTAPAPAESDDSPQTSDRILAATIILAALIPSLALVKFRRRQQV